MSSTGIALAEFDRMWADLEPVGRASSGGYRRFAWTAEDHTLREWFVAEANRRGLDLMVDRVGNQWAWWWEGPGSVDDAVRAGLKATVIGSHLDSVPDGGAFDGPLGVVSSFAALDALRARGFRPSRPVAVTNFVDEEGARFGIACAGSRVLVGALSPERALALTDADGISYAEALRTAGREPGHLGPDPEALARIGTFIELHVEQGRAMVDLGAPVGVASDIWPHGRWRFDFPGEANHAGTTRLEDRRDAMLGYAELVLAARQVATHRGCVATVGKVHVTPNGVNAIASQVTGWLDARGADEGQVRALVDELTERAGERDAHVTQESWTPTTHFDADLTERLRQILQQPGQPISVPVLGTGAGHDAGILATAGIPSAMLFVRNPTGISHSPQEYAETGDCHAGVLALADCVADLAGDLTDLAGLAGAATHDEAGDAGSPGDAE